jgi:hypothetical protein
MTPELKQDIQEKKSRWRGIMLKKLIAIEQFIEANPDIPFTQVTTGGLRCTCVAEAHFLDEEDPFPAEAYLYAAAHSRKKKMFIELDFPSSYKEIVVQPTTTIPDLRQRCLAPRQSEAGDALDDENIPF